MLIAQKTADLQPFPLEKQVTILDSVKKVLADGRILPFNRLFFSIECTYPTGQCHRKRKGDFIMNKNFLKEQGKDSGKRYGNRRKHKADIRRTIL